MAQFLQTSRIFLQNAGRSQLAVTNYICKRWNTAQHTLAVKKKIDKKREEALKAGGEKRIANQHKKVVVSNGVV